MPCTHDQQLREPGFVSAVQAGQAWALQYACDHCRYCCLAAATSRVGSAEDAEDIVQHTFEEFMQAAPAFRGDSTLRGWLMAITENHCVEYHRRMAREKKVITELPAGFEEVFESGAEEDQILLRITLERLLRSLPPRERQVLHLRFYEDLKYDEIAQTLSISVGAVAGVISQAIRRLGSLLEAGKN